MRWRPLTWMLLSVFFFVAAFYCWRLGDEWEAKRAGSPGHQSTNSAQPGAIPAKPAAQSHGAPGTSPAVTGGAAIKAKHALPLSFRLSNTTKSASQLARSDRAILLENALLDTAQPTTLAIPDHLRAQGDPGTYIIQSDKPLDDTFRARLSAAGASIVSYIPNNAYLVRASQAQADSLANPDTTVLPYEPYYKLKSTALVFAVQQMPLPDDSVLNLLLFSDAQAATLSALRQMGVEVLGQDRSPFGPVLRVRPGSTDPAASSPPPPEEILPSLARLPGVQEVEMAHVRVPANDLSRVTVGVATNSTTPTNYLGLDGTGVLVNVNDTGIDITHPDLVNRVFFDSPLSMVDSNGHGTHVAGIIAGNGTESMTMTNPFIGSVTPTVTGQFRGKAPKSQLFSMLADPLGGPYVTDMYLQETAAQTNGVLGQTNSPIISNNSWNYGGDNAYDLAAASYDAAVRDALPLVPGSQPVLYVFAAGDNAGTLSGGVVSGGVVNIFDDVTNYNGTGESGDTILSPGTAKNVITVGALQQERNITNETWQCVPDPASTNGMSCVTNQPWLPSTATGTGDQVADFSSRGNVGIGVEGAAGRFKPDVVAPGTFILSTRSSQWNEQAYYNPTNYQDQFYTGLQATTNLPWNNSIFVPDNAVQVSIQVFAPIPLPIYVNQNGGPALSGFVRTNTVTMPPDGGSPLNPVGTFYNYAIGDPTNQPVTFDLFTQITVTNQYGNFLEVLSNLNDSLGPFYRFESGTSMAAADVSGTLALMQQFFEQQLHLTNSPALMKALLINGARPLDIYDLQVGTSINYQGWGLINLPNSLGTLTNLTASPLGPASMFIFDQSPTNALATGQSNTVSVTVSDPAAQGFPLRVTLVWTDPPGNPVAGMKLVNDLYLMVTNKDTGDVFFGNDIQSGNDYNLPWDTNAPQNIDVVNNVQNVYLPPGLGSNYVVTVVGNRVNVNAVTAQTNDVVQDYALVISAGEGQVSDALTLTTAPNSPIMTMPLVTGVSNMFGSTSAIDVGGILATQRVGANTPLLGTNTIPLTNTDGFITLGMTNQWHFYVVTNTGGADFTNAAFLTLDAVELAVPRMGVYQENDPANATRAQADIDLYVSTDPTITNLSPVALSNAWKSVGRLGQETIVLSNAVSGQTYYAGVKSEDQMAAQYTFLADFSNVPFSGSDAQGDQFLRGFPEFSPIPNGTPTSPGILTINAICVAPIQVRRVVVTNNITHELMGDLLGTLTHGSQYSVLNNHEPNYGVTNVSFIYDDSAENNIFGAQHTDGPGSLNNFAGLDGSGQWTLKEQDNTPVRTGTNNFLYIFLEKQQPLTSGLFVTLTNGACANEFEIVPNAATSWTITAFITNGVGPVTMQVFLDNPDGTQTLYATNLITTATNSITIDQTTIPPLVPGEYTLRLCNVGNFTATVFLIDHFSYNFGIAGQAKSYEDNTPQVIPPDAVSYSTISVSNHQTITSLDVGLLIEDPEISDLAITLISPNGTRVLLMEDRGGTSTNGLGSFNLSTNYLIEPAYTNNFDTAPVGLYDPGAMFEGWSVLSNSVQVLDDFTCLCLSNHVLALMDGMVSNTLPTTNVLSATITQTNVLSYKVTHAPWLMGMVAWWPFDGDGTDIFGGYDGLLFGDVTFGPGEVNDAFMGDGIATRMVVPKCPDLDLGLGRGFTVEGWINPSSVTNIAPLVEWIDPTNRAPFGVQFWLDGLPGSNTARGSLWANIWDTNRAPHVIGTTTNALTNGVWQHVALTYDTNTHTAVLYTNGYRAFTEQFPSNFVPRTSGDLYFGYHPTNEAINPPIVTNSFLSSVVAPRAEANRSIPPTVGDNTWNQTVRVQTIYSSTHFPTNPIIIRQLRYRPDPTYGFAFNTTIPNIRFDLSTTTNAVYYLHTNFAQNIGTNDTIVFSGPLSASSQFAGPAGGPKAFDMVVPLTTPFLYDPRAGNLLVDVRDYSGSTASPLDGSDPFIYPPTPGNYLASRAVNYPDVNATNASFIDAGHAALEVVYEFAPSVGLDEFSIYNRALSDCEVAAIYHADSRGKYGTNCLTCPVTNAVELLGIQGGNATFTFTNGLAWTNGPSWETNTIVFTSSTANPSNPTPVIVYPLDPNVVVDDFVLSTTVPETIDGQVHFTENTNLALLPIKFAPTPYTTSNAPPFVFYTNAFDQATAMVYQAGSTILGSSNSAGQLTWYVTNGPVTIVSNISFGCLGTNWLALANGAVQCVLPTTPGGRYELSYTLRGPCAVDWWTGEVDPLSGRALDAISANNGLFLMNDTNVPNAANLNQGFVRTNGLYFGGPVEPVPPAADPDTGPDNDDPGGKIELGDPVQLRFTNSFTIECWLNPLVFPEYDIPQQVEQIFWRGDQRDGCTLALSPPYFLPQTVAPYYLAIERSTDTTYSLLFHIQGGNSSDCGVTLETSNAPVVTDQWQHLAAVFQTGVVVTNGTTTHFTNQLALYLNGQQLSNVFLMNALGDMLQTAYTDELPFQDLDPAYSPGVAIGNRARSYYFEPYIGYMDELTVYARALTAPEIAAIYNAGTAGKADFNVAPTESLAELSVSVDGVTLDVAHADNSQCETHTVQFYANDTNAVLTLQSLLPGTLLSGITLTALPAELHYLPEESLAALDGQDAFGTWRLEIWDTRAGATNPPPELVNWSLNFQSIPLAPQPVITLEHGIIYTNILPAGGVQYFVVPVPQWATNATNMLLVSTNYQLAATMPVGVLFGTNGFPSDTNDVLFRWPPQPAPQTNVLTTNTASLPNTVTNLPVLTPGYAYYLTVTNPNPYAATFAVGVWFNLDTLTNCEMETNFVGPAGIPVYYQFQVPTNVLSTSGPPQQVTLLLSGARSNLTVVVNEHLPLPDLDHYDYTSDRPCTNDQVVMVLTNTTPFPIQSNTWYVGIFNSQATNVPFQIELCYITNGNGPLIIPLTNALPFVVSSPTNQFAAPPGPPQTFFFHFMPPGSPNAILFELYNLTGDLDLVLQRDIVPGMAPYFAGSYEVGLMPEQIVLRTGGPDLDSLQHDWYLGLYNKEQTNVTYTIRASVDTNGLLLSGQPLVEGLQLLNNPSQLLLGWNSIEGENYYIYYSPTVVPPITWMPLGTWTATTPLSTFLVPANSPGTGFFRISHVPIPPEPSLSLSFKNGEVCLSWSGSAPTETVQWTTDLSLGQWFVVPGTDCTNAAPCLTTCTNGTCSVCFPPPAPGLPTYFRLVP